MKLNVCMVGYGFHPPWIEGCSVVARNLALALRRHVRVSLISLVRLDYPDFSVENPQRDFETVRYLNPLGLFRAFHYEGKHFKPSLIYDAIRICSALQSLDSKQGVDIVHIHNVSHLVVSAVTKNLLKKKVVVHTFNMSEIGDLLSNAFVDGYICTSKLNYLQLINSGLPEWKVHLIPPIIDCNAYRPLSNRESKEKLNVSADSFLVTYIGNLFPQRFPIDVLTELKNLTKEYPELELALFTPSSFQNQEIAIRLKRLLSSSKIKHRVVVSNLSENEKVVVYNASDVLIYPFLRNIPGSIAVDPPLTILEAMACGKIVIVSRMLSVPDIIQDRQNGFLVQPGDFKGFKKTLKYVVDHFFELRYIELNARRTIEKRFTSTVANSLFELYQSIIDKPTLANAC